jgi:hypothetical protein
MNNFKNKDLNPFTCIPNYIKVKVIDFEHLLSEIRKELKFDITSSIKFTKTLGKRYSGNLTELRGNYDIVLKIKKFIVEFKLKNS